MNINKLFVMVMILLFISIKLSYSQQQNIQNTPDALCSAALNCDLLEVEKLINMGTNLQASLSNGDNLFIRVVTNSGHICVDVIKSLLKHGVDINGTDSYGYTALMRATTKADTTEELIDVLLQNPSLNLHVKNSYGQTVLMLTIDNNSFDKEKNKVLNERLEKFLKLRVGVNEQDNQGKTALMYAAKHNLLATVKLLLLYQADPNLKDNMGYTARDYIPQENHTEIEHLLKLGYFPTEVQKGKKS